MKFLSILKAIGKVGISLLGFQQSTIGQAVEHSIVPAPAAAELDKIAIQVSQAEAFGEALKAALTTQPAGTTGTGIDVSLLKSKASIPTVEAILKQWPILTGKKLQDPVRFAAGAQKIMDGTVDVLDSFEAPPAPAATA